MNFSLLRMDGRVLIPPMFFRAQNPTNQKNAYRQQDNKNRRWANRSWFSHANRQIYTNKHHRYVAAAVALVRNGQKAMDGSKFRLFFFYFSVFWDYVFDFFFLNFDSSTFQFPARPDLHTNSSRRRYQRKRIAPSSIHPFHRNQGSFIQTKPINANEGFRFL